MDWLRKYRREGLVNMLRTAGYELREAFDLLAEHLGEGVTPQTPDQGTQLPGPPAVGAAGGLG